MKELVRFDSDGTRDTDCVTILDCMPFIIDNYNASDIHRESQEKLLGALGAKKPDLVMSCFRTNTPNEFLRLLQRSCIGIVPHES